jgi:DNA topoisomerase-1
MAKPWMGYRREVRTRTVPAMTISRDDPRAAVRATGLRYATDTRPGLSRREPVGIHVSRRGREDHPRSRDPRPDPGDRHPARLDRCLDLPWPNGHLQATGRDARGRKQYRYHELWRQRRGADNFARMIAFAKALPRIRRAVEHDLGRRGLPREKVLAAVVRLLELTLIRVGNDEYARLNRSFGLTTMRDRHARIEGTQVRFRFRGKGGLMHEVGLRDRRLAAIVRRCQDLPGQELFQYVDEDGEVRDIASDDVNDYLRDVSGGDYTAKDFRTWAGTLLAYRALRALQPEDHGPAAKRNVVQAIRLTAERLGNTPAVARGSYVHPAVLDAYMDGSLGGALVDVAEEQDAPPTKADRNEEIAVVRVLKQRAREAGRSPTRRHKT